MEYVCCISNVGNKKYENQDMIILFKFVFTHFPTCSCELIEPNQRRLVNYLIHEPLVAVKNKLLS